MCGRERERERERESEREREIGREREMNVTFVVAFCFKRWMKEISVIKTYNTNILGDGDRSVFGAV